MLANVHSGIQTQNSLVTLTTVGANAKWGFDTTSATDIAVVSSTNGGIRFTSHANAGSGFISLNAKAKLAASSYNLAAGGLLNSLFGQDKFLGSDADRRIQFMPTGKGFKDTDGNVSVDNFAILSSAAGTWLGNTYINAGDAGSLVFGAQGVVPKAGISFGTKENYGLTLSDGATLAGVALGANDTFATNSMAAASAYIHAKDLYLSGSSVDALKVGNANAGAGSVVLEADSLSYMAADGFADAGNMTGRISLADNASILFAIKTSEVL